MPVYLRGNLLYLVLGTEKLSLTPPCNLAPNIVSGLVKCSWKDLDGSVWEKKLCLLLFLTSLRSYWDVIPLFSSSLPLPHSFIRDWIFAKVNLFLKRYLSKQNIVFTVFIGSTLSIPKRRPFLPRKQCYLWKNNKKSGEAKYGSGM